MGPMRRAPPVSLAARCMLVFALSMTSSSARAADWGPFVAEMLEHLATHIGMSAAEHVVEQLTQHDKMPTLQLSDEELTRKINEKIESCVRRAQQLDDQDPQRRALLGKPPLLIGPAYAEERASFQSECGSIFK